VPTNRTDGLKKKAGRLFQWLEKRSLLESLPRQEKVISKEFKWALFEEELGSRKQTETIKLIQESVSFSHLRINLSLMGDGDLRDFVFLALTGEARPHSALENYLKGWGNYWNLKEKLEKVFGSPLWEWGRIPLAPLVANYILQRSIVGVYNQDLAGGSGPGAACGSSEVPQAKGRKRPLAAKPAPASRLADGSPFAY
jgi:hypothetical protein